MYDTNDTRVNVQAGLTSTPMRPPAEKVQGPPGAAPGMGQGGPPGGVTPERQQAYEVVVTNALGYLYDRGLEKVLQRLQAGGGDPMESVGQVAGQLILGQAVSAKGAGVELDKGVIFHATREVVANVAEVAEAASLAQADEQGVNRAFLAAIDVLVTQGRGLFTEQDMARAQQAVGKLQQAGGQPPGGMQGQPEIAAQGPAQTPPQGAPKGIIPEGMA